MRAPAACSCQAIATATVSGSGSGGHHALPTLCLGIGIIAASRVALCWSSEGASPRRRLGACIVYVSECSLAA